MALIVAITEILRALCILKKGWEDIEVEWKACSEEMLLLVNNSEQVNHVGRSSHVFSASRMEVTCNRINPSPWAEH